MTDCINKRNISNGHRCTKMQMNDIANKVLLRGLKLR